jgi:hypothetical protein
MHGGFEKLCTRSAVNGDAENVGMLAMLSIILIHCRV